MIEPTFDHGEMSAVVRRSMSYGMSYQAETQERWGLKAEDSRSLSDWMQLFYSTVACDIYTGFKHHDMAQEKVKYIADYLARVVTMSCLGEARYVVLCVLHELHVRGKEPATIKRLMDGRVGRWAKALLLSFARGKQPYHSPDYDAARWAALVAEGDDWTDEDLPHIVQLDGGGSRDLAVLSKPPMGLTPLEQARLARSVFVMHTRFCGHQSPGDATDSVAGPLWAHGADLAVRYYAGKMSPMTFIDQVFDAVHNSSSILSKVVVTTNGDLEGWYLNWRQNASLDTLVMGSPRTVRQMFGIEDDDPVVPHLPLALAVRAHGNVSDPHDGAAIEQLTREAAVWWQNAEWQAVGESPGIAAADMFDWVWVVPCDGDTMSNHLTPPPKPWATLEETLAANRDASNKVASGVVHYWTQLPPMLRQWNYNHYRGANSYARAAQARIRAAVSGKYRYLWRPVSVAMPDTGSGARLVELFGTDSNLVTTHRCGLCAGKDRHLPGRLVACRGQFTWDEDLLDGSDCHSYLRGCLCKTLGFGCHEASIGECDECSGGNCYNGYDDCYCCDETCCHEDYVGDSCSADCECDTCMGAYCSQGQRGCCCQENSCCHGYEQGEECDEDCECGPCEDAREEARLAEEAEQEAEQEAAIVG